jgi:Domain of unknown function (DUF5122) beta-propeller
VLTKTRVLLPAVSLALVTVAVACGPPPPPDPLFGSTTTTTPTSEAATSSSTTSTTTTTTATTTSTTTPAGTPKLYSSQPVDGWGIGNDHVLPDDYVDAVKIVGDTVYAGGSFATAVHGPLSAPRVNVMAVQASTGNLLPFVADTDGAVMAIATDGTSLYIGGDFTTVNGVPRNRLAKLDLVTGKVDLTFKPSTGNPVYDMLVLGGRLYVVGEFNQVNGVSRQRAAALDLTTGAVDATFNPSADKPIEAIAANPAGTKLYLGGRFLNIDGMAQAYLAEVAPDTGALQGPTFERVNDYILDLSVSGDGAHVYGAGGGGLNSAVSWNASTGKRDWNVRVDGDTQAVQYSNGYVYMGFHDGYLGNNQLRLLAVDPTTGIPDPSYMPISGSFPGVYCLDADGTHLVAGGYFPNMGGVSVKGLAIFS